MSSISIFSGSFCREGAVADALVAKTGYQLVSDNDVVREASELSGIEPGKIGRAFSSKVSVFNKFTHERERAIAFMKLALAKKYLSDGCIYQGFCGLLIPKQVEHVLRVCLIADMKFRLSEAAKQDIAAGEAHRLVKTEDEKCAAWIKLLEGDQDPWNSAHYDITVPMDKDSVADAVELIGNYAGSRAVNYTPLTQRAADDFRFAAEVEVELVKEGHNVGVDAHDGKVTLTINKQVLMLNRLEEELKEIVHRATGVEQVAIIIGEGFHQTDIYRRFDFKMPSKVLLVDDEREFVQTLSERLIMRDMGSTVAYDGESALAMVQEEDPEVMILDLKMPGIDGIEVLRRVKNTRPGIEVIILTGHGSEADRKTCMDLGAFAYLQKPVNIEQLSETLKQANQKILERKSTDSVS
ncbi:MAG: response regulator [Desulfobacterales bacterium]|jgi:CheY-like chemotaxis protein